MIKRLMVILISLGVSVGTLSATPASATPDCNWSCPHPADADETRNTEKVDLGGIWRMQNGYQRLCFWNIKNDGYAWHYMRMQLIKSSNGAILQDTGFHGLYLGPGQWGYPAGTPDPFLATEPYDSHMIVKGWNDAGDVTYLDYWINVSNDTTYVHSVGWADFVCGTA
jgi:hypothetical protein